MTLMDILFGLFGWLASLVWSGSKTPHTRIETTLQGVLTNVAGGEGKVFNLTNIVYTPNTFPKLTNPKINLDVEPIFKVKRST